MSIEQIDWEETQVEAYLQRQQIVLEEEQLLPAVPPRSLLVENYCNGGLDCECLSCSAWRAS